MEIKIKIVFVALATILGIYIQSIQAKGVLQLKIEKYEGSPLLYYGSCCYEEVPTKTCNKICESYFLVCLRIPTGAGCENTYDTRNLTLGSKSFEMEFYSAYNGAFQLLVDVRSTDGLLPNGLVDKYDYLYNSKDYQPADNSTTSIELHGRRTKLFINARVTCARDYYGKECNTHCIPKNDDFGHYTCDNVNGKKVCLPSWGGKDCMQDLSPCGSYPCLNGGSCISTSPDSYRCICPRGYQGKRCETALEPCQHYIKLTSKSKLASLKPEENVMSRVKVDKAWYRLVGTTRNRLAVICRKQNACQSSIPIYMTGWHPSLDDGVVERDVCISGHEDCCVLKMSIKVKRCREGDTDYFVYQLRKPLTGAMGYCME